MFGAVIRLGVGWVSVGVRGELGRIIMWMLHTTARRTPFRHTRNKGENRRAKRNMKKYSQRE